MSITRRQLLVSSSFFAIYPSVFSIIKVSPNGLEVLGKITHRSASDISIEIVRPYKNLSGGSHIPYFARAGHSYDGQAGDDTARKLLAEVYEIGKYLEENMPGLQREFWDIKYSDSLALDKFFNEQFSLTISYGTRSEVVGILKGRKNLM